MPTPNPEHLFEQAEALAARPAGGAPRQVDLRRAISAAYYGLFHFCLAQAADEFVGARQRSTSRYSLFYRSIDHGSLRTLCEEARKSTLRPKYAAFFPTGGFDRDIQSFSEAALDLREKRNSAGYDPQPRFRTLDAMLAIRGARKAVNHFRTANEEHRKTFLALLVCPPR